MGGYECRSLGSSTQSTLRLDTVQMTSELHFDQRDFVCTSSRTCTPISPCAASHRFGQPSQAWKPGDLAQGGRRGVSRCALLPCPSLPCLAVQGLAWFASRFVAGQARALRFLACCLGSIHSCCRAASIQAAHPVHPTLLIRPIRPTGWPLCLSLLLSQFLCL